MAEFLAGFSLGMMVGQALLLMGLKVMCKWR